MRGSSGAALIRPPEGVAAAVFPSEPERAVYNNALFERDLDADQRIAAVKAMEAARRRGLGTALAALHPRHAQTRGCTTASLQATEMAEGVYTGLGFRDLGRFLEYAP